MTDKGGRSRSRPRGRAALKQIDLQLDGLLGKLGDTLGEMIERLEDGETGEFRRSHELQTPRGPVRAEAGLRVRMGLGDAAGTPDSPPFARPVRTPPPEPGSRAAPAAGAPEAAGADPEPGRTGAARPADRADPGATDERPLRIDAYSADGRLVLSADMPGVSLPEVTVAVEGGEIAVTAAGRRRYAGRHPLPAGADPADMDIALRNGVLEVTMGMAQAGGAE